MSEARRRADLRRDAAERFAIDHPPRDAPQVPRLRMLNTPIRQALYEQIEHRRPKAIPRSVFIEALLTAGCELLDQLGPETPPAVPVELPPGIADAAQRLQEIKRGTR